MSWQTEMGEMLRVMVNDMASTTYTDLVLQRTLAVAALQVGSTLVFTMPFTGLPDPTNPTITPDPTDPNATDLSFINLTCIKAACIISHGSAMVAAQQAIAVRDGSSSVDLRGIMQGKLALLQKGWCAVYEEEKLQYLANQSSAVAGAVVMTPFRTLVYGSRGQLLTVPGRERQPVY